MAKDSLHATIVAVTLGVGAALAIAYWGNSTWPVPPAPPPPAAPVIVPIDERDAGRALEYASALQEDDCETALALTLWVRDRLDRVRLEGGDVEIERAALCSELLQRHIEGNQIGAGGIEDQYLFRAGVTFTVLGVDEGPGDLARPAGRRVWFKFVFPSEALAPLDEAGRPIRSLRAGVSVSRDGYILKAGVIGNLEIDVESFDYAWPRDLGE